MKRHFITSLILICIISFIHSNALSNQADLKSGIDNFISNNFAEAEKMFTAAAQDPATQEEAYLYLSLINSSQYTYQKAQKYFRKFYDVSSNAEHYVAALWITPCVTNGYGKKSEDELEFLQKILQNENLESVLKGHIYEVAGMHYNASNDFETADELKANIGSIDKWQLVGEFRNISESGFDKDYPPITHPKMDAVFKNKNGAKIKWFKLTERRPGKWISLSNNFYTARSIIYAQTFCYSPDEKEVHLRVGTSGSLKAWVNDNLAISESEERNNGLDTYIAKVKLHTGYNRILLQIGIGEQSGSNFIARITDLNGKLFEDLEYHDEYYDYKADKTYKPEIIRNSSEVFFEEKIKNNPDNILNYILLANMYLQNDKSYEARKTIRKAMKLAPDCSYLIKLMMEVHSRDNNATGLSMEIERLKDIAPESNIALEFIYDREIDNENYEKVSEIIDKLSKAYGEKHPLILSKKINFLAAKKKNDELNDLLDEAFDLYPENATFVLLKYYMEIQKNNIDEAKDILEDYFEENYSSEICKQLAISYLRTGDISEGLDLFKYLIKDSPSSDGPYKELGDLYFQVKDYEEAIEYYQTALDISPYTGFYYEKIGNAYQELYNTFKANESYNKCIKYSPTNYEVRRKLRENNDKKPVFDYFVNQDCYQLFKDAPEADQYPEDNYVFLLDEVQKVVYKTGGSEEKYYVLIKVFNASGIDRWKEYYLPVSYNQDYHIEKAEVLKKDGNKIKAEQHKNQIVFTNLEEGDAILLIYKLETYQYDKLTKHFWDKHYFSFFAPYKISKYSLLIEPGVKFDYLTLNSDLQPVVSKKDGFDLYVWEEKDRESVKYEAYMSSLADVGEALHLSTIPDWDWISKWYSDISKNKAKSDFEVQESVAELFKGKENLSVEEKIKTIYDFIVKNIRYSSVSFRQHNIIPQKASRTLNTKMGDCKDVSTLFVAMCKEVGIDAQIMLINLRNNGKNDLALPSMDFEHVIAKVKIDGKDYYIEMTSDKNSYKTIGYNLKKAFALEISDDPNKKVEPMFLDPDTRIENSIYRKGSIIFNANNAKVSKQVVRYGDWASSFRNTYRDLGAEARKKKMRESIAYLHANIKLDNFNIDKTIDKTTDSLTYAYEYSTNNVFSVISDMMIFKLPWSNAQKPKDFLSMEERKFPVEFWKYKNDDVVSETLNIKIPEGKELTEAPANLHYSCNIADYNLDFTLVNDELIVKRQMKYKDDYVPLKDYNNFKKFFENVINADAKQIAFKEKKK